MKEQIAQKQMNLPEYYWEIQIKNNVTGELIQMVKRETLSDALDVAWGAPADLNPTMHVALIHRTEDTLLAAPMRGQVLSEYFEDISMTNLERVPGRFRKEFEEMIHTV